MSQKTVHVLIGRLLTDEEYRLRFLADRSGFLNALRDDGLELSDREIASLLHTDPTLWSDAASRIHSDLQRSSLRPD